MPFKYELLGLLVSYIPKFQRASPSMKRAIAVFRDAQILLEHTVCVVLLRLILEICLPKKVKKIVLARLITQQCMSITRLK